MLQVHTAANVRLVIIIITYTCVASLLHAVK